MVPPFFIGRETAMATQRDAAGHMTPAEFAAAGGRIAAWLARYMERVGDYPVRAAIKPGEVLAALPGAAPAGPVADTEEEITALLGELERVIMPGITHWQSPRFMGYFPANASGPAILGELLAAGLGVNGMLWSTSPAATELEIGVLEWLRTLVGLPGRFAGNAEHGAEDGTGRVRRGGAVIQGTASEAVLVALCAARRRVRWGGVSGAGAARDVPLAVYCSAQAHSSVVKAAMIAGLADGPEDTRSVRQIATDERLALRVEVLEAALRADVAAGMAPALVVATAGTTGTTAFDPVPEIAAAMERAGVTRARGAVGPAWLHIDAAHAGAAAVCPEFRWVWRGAEHADSVCFNPHKWLLTNFDCDCFYTADREMVTGALAITPEYLRNPAATAGGGEMPDFRDWQVPLGRRFRALKLWLVLRYYGAAGLRRYIRGHVELAREAEEWIRADERFEVVAPRMLNLVCFRLRGARDEPARVNEANRALLNAANATGRVFLTHTVLPDGALVLRMCIGSTTVTRADVEEAWEVVRRAADAGAGLS